MKTYILQTIVFGLLFLNQNFYSQNESQKWYFGDHAGLDFSTEPPSILTNGSILAYKGCSSISDGVGNLLFYTDGITVWNKNHFVMSNGTGLFGSGGAFQGPLIVKQPGSQTNYFIFTAAQNGGTNGFRYSVVDMTLASGDGSVTIKNFPLYAAPVTEKITGTKHCNGTDVWVVAHDYYTSTFRTYQVSSAGVSTTAVTSTIGSVHTGAIGAMKISAEGKKLGLAIHTATGSVEVFDFNNSTGVISNSLSLLSNFYLPWGLEISPDGTKVYASLGGSSGDIYQWDLCAGNNAAIVSSQINIAPMTNYGKGQLQLASNGKIYVAQPSSGTVFLGVINAPNSAGANCNFVEHGIQYSSNQSTYSLPNFISSLIKIPFTYTVGNSCLTASFSSASFLSTSGTSCSAAGPTAIAESWDFGDPASGSANTSTISNPVHTYPSVGDYTVHLIRYTSCGIDTVKQKVSVKGPALSVFSKTLSCNGLVTASVSTQSPYGPYTYTWMPGGHSSALVNNLSPGIYTITVQGNTQACVKSITTTIATPSVVTLQSTISAINSCTTGKAYIILSGGSGNYGYVWSPGAFTSSFVPGLSSGIYSVTATDNIHQCTHSGTVQVLQWPTPTLTVSGNRKVCKGDSTVLLASGADKFIWWIVTSSTPSSTTSQGFIGPTLAVTPTTSSITYTLEGINTIVVNGTFTMNTCTSSTIVNINVYQNPTITVNGNYTICSGETATVQLLGGDTYTIDGISSGSIAHLTPTVTSSFMISGTTNQAYCSDSETLTIHVNSCTGLKETEAQTGPNVYPNPTTGKIYFEIGADFKVSIYDPSGRLIKEKNLKTPDEVIDLSDYENGIYFLNCEGESVYKNLRVIKIN